MITTHVVVPVDYSLPLQELVAKVGFERVRSGVSEQNFSCPTTPDRRDEQVVRLDCFDEELSSIEMINHLVKVGQRPIGLRLLLSLLVAHKLEDHFLVLALGSLCKKPVFDRADYPDGHHSMSDDSLNIPVSNRLGNGWTLSLELTSGKWIAGATLASVPKRGANDSK